MIPNRARQATSNPQLDLLETDDGSKSIYDHQIDETYHSGSGAAIESYHVYLRNSGLEGCLANGSSTSVSVFEMGFGLGWNFLLTASLATCHQKSIRYLAVESRLLPSSILKQLDMLSSLPVLESFPDRHSFKRVASQVEKKWLSVRAELSDEDHGIFECPINDWVHLGLWLTDARQEQSFPWLEPFDFVYFDPFSPQSNPELWTEANFRRIFHAMSPRGTLATYCVKSSVRAQLTQVGFLVERLPGPPNGKREVLRAVKPA